MKPGDATAGQAKAAVCGACHGMDGNSSDAQYPKLAGQSEQYIVRQLTDFKASKRQNPIMLGMATPLSTQDMHDVGAYFASKTPLPGVADQALVEKGETLFRQGDSTRGIPACMACHSIDGRGNPGAMYPQLTSQHAQYIQATLKAWHDGTTWGDDAHAQIMPTIAKKLDADDIAALSSYIEGLHSADTQPAATP
ncbi:cytochrome c4 [Rhodanobacter panaciterrae]|uniref:Cytochrome c4 n=1 Tax=Rhodanobacter panaciterrae TaxID=490572 RepID=A0ABQ3A5B8_9GAMM|nr:cytochrome c4 [Rhodanobacter panaciterrae]